MTVLDVLKRALPFVLHGSGYIPVSPWRVYYEAEDVILNLSPALWDVPVEDWSEEESTVTPRGSGSCLCNIVSLIQQGCKCGGK